MRDNKGLRAVWSIAIIVIFLVLLTWFFGSIHRANEGYSVPMILDDGWEIEQDNQILENQTLSEFSFAVPTKKGETVTIRRILPEELPKVASYRELIFLSTVEVKVDGKTVYTYGQEIAERGGFVGSGNHIVNLPEDAGGKEIEVTFTAYSSGAMSNIPMPDILPTEYVYEEFFDENVVLICCCIFLFSFGVILTIMGLLARIQKSSFAPIVHIGVFSFLIGYWALCNTKIIQLFSVDMSLNTATEYMSLYFAMLPLLLLMIRLRSRAEEWKKRMLLILCLVLAVFAVVTTVLHWSGRLFYPETITLFHILSILEALGMLAASVQLGRQKVLSERILNFALLEILVAGVMDILRFNLQKYVFPDADGMDLSILPFGVLIFILLLIISYVVGLYASVIDETEKETLVRLAYKDTLTDLYNRSMSEKLFRECDEEKRDYALVNLDLNGLKKVNDTFGHASGDQLIKDFAEILKESFGEIGTIARMGGDEFVVVVKDPDKIEIDRAIDRMVRLEEDRSWEKDYEISSSYGIAVRQDIPEGSAEQLYKLADERMYEMKVRSKKQRVD